MRKILNLLILIRKILIPKKYHHLLTLIFLNLLRPLCIGNKVLCPCCNKKFRKFLPLENNPNEVCLKCGSFERHRLLWLYIKNQTNLLSDKLKVLHFAPEYVFQKLLRSLPLLYYVSADLDSSLAMISMDITSIAFKDNTFDAILCIHVLEHIENDTKALKELYRVLKPGGWAIIQVPIDLFRQKTFSDPKIVSPKERARVYGRKDHVRIYGKDYEDKLKVANFNVETTCYTDILGSEKMKGYGLAKKRCIFFCTK